MSLFSNFPQGGKKAGVQSISDGGTGATTAEAALANLGGFPKADGEALKTRIQPINLGGTAASEANQARQNLGAAAVKEMTKAEYDALPAIDPTIFYALTDVEADGVKIEVGSYVGTGVAASASSPHSITFPFAPKLVSNLSGFDEHPIPTAKLKSSEYISVYNWSVESGKPAKMKISTDGKTIYWYSTHSGAQHEMNTSGTTYYYYGIG